MKKNNPSKRGVSDEQKKKMDIPSEAFDGIFVTDAPSDGAAYSAGIRKGDKIMKINGNEISCRKCAAQLVQMARFSCFVSRLNASSRGLILIVSPRNHNAPVFRCYAPSRINSTAC